MGKDEHEKNLFGQKNEKDTRRAVSLGNVYITNARHFQAEVYHDGIVRLSLMRDIPISKRLRGGLWSILTMSIWQNLIYLY
jgi:hypothetical protein